MSGGAGRRAWQCRAGVSCSAPVGVLARVVINKPRKQESSAAPSRVEAGRVLAGEAWRGRGVAGTRSGRGCAVVRMADDAKSPWLDRIGWLGRRPSRQRGAAEKGTGRMTRPSDRPEENAKTRQARHAQQYGVDVDAELAVGCTRPRPRRLAETSRPRAKPGGGAGQVRRNCMAPRPRRAPFFFSSSVRIPPAATTLGHFRVPAYVAASDERGEEEGRGEPFEFLQICDDPCAHCKMTTGWCNSVHVSRATSEKQAKRVPRSADPP